MKFKLVIKRFKILYNIHNFSVQPLSLYNIKHKKRKLTSRLLIAISAIHYIIFLYEYLCSNIWKVLYVYNFVYVYVLYSFTIFLVFLYCMIIILSGIFKEVLTMHLNSFFFFFLFLIMITVQKSKTIRMEHFRFVYCEFYFIYTSDTFCIVNNIPLYTNISIIMQIHIFIIMNIVIHL